MIELDLECNQCHSNLEFTLQYTKWGVELLVEPCDGCLDASYKEGYDDGFKEGEGNE